jgi:hypothetical protein
MRRCRPRDSADNKISESLDDFTRVSPIAQNQFGGGEVQRQTEQRRNEQQGRQDGKFQRLLKNKVPSKMKIDM